MLKRVLFLCTGNSCRSQMAEAVLRARGGGRFVVSSAGTAPAGIDPRTLEVLVEAGYDVSGLWSKHFDELDGRQYDYIITLCDSARQTCPFIPGTAARIHWSIPDPAAAPGTAGEVMAAFRAVLSELERRIDAFVSDPAGAADGEGQGLVLQVTSTAPAGGTMADGGSDPRPGGSPAPGTFPDGVRTLSPSEAFEEVGSHGALIVDLRPDHETSYRVFDIGEVYYLPRREFAAGYADLPRDRPLILADAVGLWSREAARILLEAGFTDVSSLTGGIIDWERDGLPIRKDRGFEMNGQCSCKLRSQKGGSPGARGGRPPDSGS